MTATGYFTRRLVWQPVQHACSHYEVRLMAAQPALVQAGSPCSTCAPQGRPVQPHYTMLANAQNVAGAQNKEAGR
jgi:hypothetical protein